MSGTAETKSLSLKADHCVETLQTQQMTNNMQGLLDEGACTAKEHNSLTQAPENAPNSITNVSYCCLLY